jgi:prepilin-type N-terminal cleavage/methylation domain-containing protein
MESRGRLTVRAPHGFSLLELMMVVAVSGVLAAIAFPMMSGVGRLRVDGDARNLSHAVTQAKMVAAAKFTRSRLYVDLTVNTYHTEIWQKTGTPGWVLQGGDTYLSNSTESFSFGVVSSAPPNTQAVIAQAPPCLDDAGNPIGNTACVLFNSRGIPIDPTGAPTGAYALYITDGTAVFGVTMAATSAVRLWRTNPVSTPAWVQP